MVPCSSINTTPSAMALRMISLLACSLLSDEASLESPFVDLPPRLCRPRKNRNPPPTSAAPANPPPMIRIVCIILCEAYAYYLWLRRFLQRFTVLGGCVLWIG